MQQLNAQRGGTVVGFIVGLVLGLAIAVVVALIITKAPIPFVNKLAHSPDKVDTDPGKLPDPNKSLYAHEGNSEGTPAVLGNTPDTPPANTVTPVTAPVIVANSPATPGPPSAPTPADGKPALLQAGAYTSGDAAENMKAKLALLGFEANVSTSTRDGAQVFRVRLGPYSHIDDLNRVRQRLAENGIDAGIVPTGK
jgi:cell division protein FtsN